MIVANTYVWRAELTIGTMYGYEGPSMFTLLDLVPHIEAFQRKYPKWFAVCCWGDGLIVGPNFPQERVIKLSLESNPMYTPEATEEAITSYATDLANHLAITFQQERIYVAVYQVRSMIVERTHGNS